MAEKEVKEEKMMKKSNKKKAGIIAGSVVAAGIIAGGATIGIIAGTAKITVKYETGVDDITFNSQPIKKGGTANLPTPLRAGYKFLGWYLDADGNVPANSNTKFSNDTTLYAQWKANEYSVNLKDEVLNTEITTPTYKAAYSDQNLNTLNLPILENVWTADKNTALYTFKGWKDETGNIVASVDQSFNGTTIPFGVKLYGATLYAAWEGAPVDIYFGDDFVGTKYLGDVIALNQGASEDFYNWTVNASSKDVEYWKMAGAPGANITLTSDLITINGTKIEIRFSIEEGEATGPEYNVLGESYTANSELENVTREGYTFGGWYLNNDFTTRVVKTEDEAANLGLESGKYVVGIPKGNGRVVLYAKMLANNVTIKYNYGNAKLRAGFSSTPSDTFTAGERILIPAHARSYMGFDVDFIGWEYNGTRLTIGETFVVPTNVAEITLNAVWGSAYNLLNFNLQGGAITGNNQIEYNYNELKTYSMPDVTVSKLGYEFVGWSLNPNTLPNDEANIIKADGEYTINAQTTLYAIWQAKQYSIDYNLNNGSWSGEGNRTSASFGNNVTLSNTPTRAGYSFVRWDVTYYNASGVSYLVPIADKGVLSINSSAIESLETSTVKVSAVWEANTYFFKINNLENANDAHFVHIEDVNGNTYDYNYSGVTIPYDSKITIDVNGAAGSSIAAKAHYNKVIGIVIDDGSVGINAETGAYTANKMYSVDADNSNLISFTFADFDATTAGSTINYKINREADRVKIAYVYEDATGAEQTKLEEQTTYYDIASTATGNSASVLNLKDYLAVSGATDTKNRAGNYFYYWVVTDTTGKDYYFDGNGVPIAGKTYSESLFIDTPNASGGTTLSINNLVGANDTITIKAYYGAPIYATVNYVDYEGGTSIAQLKYDVTAVDGSLTKTIYINDNANIGEVNGTAMPTASRDGYTFDGWSLKRYSVVKGDNNEWVIDPEYKVSDYLEVSNTTNLESDLVRTVYARYTPKSYDVYVVNEQNSSEDKWLLSEKITVQPNNSLIDKPYRLDKERILSLNNGIRQTTTIDSKQYDLVGFTYTAGQEPGQATTNSSVIIYGTKGGPSTPALVDDGDGNLALYIYVVWGEQQYKYIEYYANNGEGTSTKAQMYNMADEPLAQGTTEYSYGYNTLKESVTITQFAKAPTRVGYTFVGWFNEAGVKVDSVTFSKYSSANDADRIYKLFAHWQAKTYNVVYYNEDETVYNTLENALTFDGEYTLGQILSTDDSGNDFVGWAYGINVENKAQVVTATSNAALAQLIAGGKVKIDADMLASLLADASATEANWNKNVKFYPIYATPSERYVTLTNITTPDGENAFGVTDSSITFTTGVYGSKIKYGTIVTISIEDLIADINDNQRKNTAYRVEHISYTDVSGVEHNNVKEGFITLTWGDEAPVITLNWVEDQVDLTFDLNDGSGRTVTIRSVINSSELIENRLNAVKDTIDVSAALNPAHKEGNDENGRAYYTFLGWASKANATNAEWLANVNGKDNEYQQTSKYDTTLYAVWQENFITIEFVAGNNAVTGDLPTTLRLVKNTVADTYSARAANDSIFNDYKLWEDNSNFDLANHNFAGWTYSIENRDTTGNFSVGETLSGSFLSGLITGGLKNDHLVLTANWKLCLTDGTVEGSEDYFTADGAIDWAKVTAMEGYNGEISLPTTIHGTSVTSLSAGKLNLNNNSVKVVYLPKSVTALDSGSIVSNSLTNVVIPSSVKTIGAGAIVTSNLTSLTIPNKAVVLAGNPIKADATATTHNFETYNLKTYETDTAKTKEESDYTYKLVDGCIINTAGIRLIAIPQQYNATEFTFEDIGFTNINSIASYAFSGVASLDSLVFSDSITSVSTKAIGNMPNLTNFTLSSSTPILQTELFDKGVTNLTNISGGNYNGIYVGSDGNLYNSNASTIVKYSAAATSITLNSNLIISEFALDGMNNLHTLTLEAGTEKFAEQLKQISRRVNYLTTSWETLNSSIYALSNPTALTVYSSIIPERVYEGATSLQSLTLGNEVTNIAASAFKNATKLSNLTIGSNIATIGTSAFEGTLLNRALTIPASVQTIGDRAFANSQITDINFSTGSQLTSIGEQAYANIEGINKLDLSNCSRLSSIKSEAFMNSSLSSITLPSSIKSIGAQAFAYCSNLSSFSTGGSESSVAADALLGVVLHNVTLLGVPSAYAAAFSQGVAVDNITFNYDNPKFDDIKNITPLTNPSSVYFSDRVVSIAAEAFSAGFNNVSSITLGNNITGIATGTFASCSKLTSLTIGTSLTAIGNSAFSTSCDGLNVYAPSLETWLNINFSVNLLSCTNSSLYINNELLTELVVPSGITEIKSGAFSGYKKLTSVDIGNSVATIGMSFNGCNNITSLRLGENVTSANYSFDNCTGLTAIYVPSIETWLNISFATSSPVYNPLYYAKNLYVNNSLLTNLVIPTGITTIDFFKFYNCESLTSVSMASSVTSIKNLAFVGCVNLTTVTIGSGVQSIMDSAFANCSKLKTLTTGGSETNVASGAFTGVELTSITLNALPTAYKSVLTQTTAVKNITFNYASPSIKTSSSGYNSELVECLRRPTQINFGANVTTISNYAFYGLTSITSMTMSNNITTIGTSAFEGCLNIAGNLNLPHSLNSLGENAFRNCAGFTGGVTIPSGVSIINNRTFAGCTGLTSVRIPSSVKTIVAPDYGGSPFFGCSGELEIYCGVNSKPDGWDQFWNLYEMPGYKYLTVHWDNTEMRSAIANYAAQYIGNKYVYGGTSLTNGCDAAGFTLSVYKEFGISLPHSITGQVQCGAGVDVRDYNIGDLVFWTSGSSKRVGIYEGVGYVIACIPNSGVQRVQVSSFTAVRSFF